MRIIQLTQSYPPMVSGAALFVQRLSEGLSNRGHQVLVVTASDQLEPYCMSKGYLTVDRCRSIHHPLRVGQRFAGWPHRSIMRNLEAFSPDIIHLHDPIQFAHSALSYASKKNVPVILTVHQLPWFLSAYLPDILKIKPCAERIMWSYLKWLLKQCSAVITPTRTVASVVRAHTGINPDTISYGVDLNIYNNNEKNLSSQKVLFRMLGIPQGKPLILYVGRLDIDKQAIDVIEGAAKAVTRKMAHLLIVGDGTQKNKLMERCHELGIEQQSYFTGFIHDQSLLSAIYRSSSVFVTASEIETQGLTLLEAAASGLPIVAYRATCIPEIVHHDVNGKLVEPGDKNSLSDAILEILTNTKLARSMGTAGSKIASQHSVHNTVIHYERLAINVIEEYLHYSYAQLRALPERVKK